MKRIYTLCNSIEDADALGHYIMSKGYEGVQNGSYRYCLDEIKWKFNSNARHNLYHVFVGVNGGQMVVGRAKRHMRKLYSEKYIEKERVFRELLERV